MAGTRLRKRKTPVWPGWATGLSVVSLILLGTGWLLAQLTLLINAYRLHDGSTALIEREHRAVCDALEAGDDDRAGQLLRLHLDNDLRRAQTAIAAR